MDLKFWKPGPDGEPRLIWAERANAWLYALAVAIGVPLLSVFIHDPLTKWVITALWFCLAAPLYLFLEGREIRGQMTGRGAIDSVQATSQIRTGQLPFWGAIMAVIIWIIGLAINIVSAWPQPSFQETAMLFLRAPIDSSIYYDLVEWMILAHTVLVTRISTVTFDGILSEFLKATPRAERAERRLRD